MIPKTLSLRVDLKNVEQMRKVNLETMTDGPAGKHVCMQVGMEEFKQELKSTAQPKPEGASLLPPSPQPSFSVTKPVKNR